MVTLPNFTVFGRIDCVRPIIVWPTSEKSCYLTIYHLFPEEFFSRPDFEEILKVYKDYQLTVLNEDRTMIESMQKAMANPDYEPGRMSTLKSPCIIISTATSTGCLVGTELLDAGKSLSGSEPSIVGPRAHRLWE